MKFLQIDDLVLNTNCITQIFIDKENTSSFYYIVIFYEGYDFNNDIKTKKYCYYRKNIEDYDLARKILQKLLNELNNI